MQVRGLSLDSCCLSYLNNLRITIAKVELTAVNLAQGEKRVMHRYRENSTEAKESKRGISRDYSPFKPGANLF